MLYYKICLVQWCLVTKTRLYNAVFSKISNCTVLVVQYLILITWLYSPILRKLCLYSAILRKLCLYSPILQKDCATWYGWSYNLWLYTLYCTHFLHGQCCITKFYFFLVTMWFTFYVIIRSFVIINDTFSFLHSTVIITGKPSAKEQKFDL